MVQLNQLVLSISILDGHSSCSMRFEPFYSAMCLRKNCRSQTFDLELFQSLLPLQYCFKPGLTAGVYHPCRLCVAETRCLSQSKFDKRILLQFVACLPKSFSSTGKVSDRSFIMLYISLEHRNDPAQTRRHPHTSYSNTTPLRLVSLHIVHNVPSPGLPAGITRD